MAAKNNIRSIRFSDDILAAIEAQVGRNFTEKFENIVTRCLWELPATEEKLKDLEGKIQDNGAGVVFRPRDFPDRYFLHKINHGSPLLSADSRQSCRSELHQNQCTPDTWRSYGQAPPER